MNVREDDGDGVISTVTILTEFKSNEGGSGK